jgi:hypothetical protein
VASGPGSADRMFKDKVECMGPWEPVHESTCQEREFGLPPEWTPLEISGSMAAMVTIRRGTLGYLGDLWKYTP